MNAGTLDEIFAKNEVKSRMAIFKTSTITVRYLKKEDEQLLVSWLSNPEVLQYYEGRDRPHDIERVREQFYVDDEESRCIVEYKGIPIGYIQFYLLDEESKREYGYEQNHETMYATDQFIGEPNYWNRGIGKLLITSMVSYLIDLLKADKVVMDPQVWNERAIACYEKCGFRKVKMIKEHEMHEGLLRDCWIVEYSKK